MITAKEIQQEALTAQNQLVETARRIISGKEKSEAHAKRLRELGFTGSAIAIEEDLQNAKRIDDLVDMYSFEYPRLRFLAYETMSELCEKHGLAVGHVSKYMGEVPEWALDQIAANKHHISYKEEFSEEAYLKAARDKHSIKCLDAENSGMTGSVETSYWANGRGGSRTLVTGYVNGKRFSTIYRTDGNADTCLDRKHGMVQVSNLMIAAPIAEMDIRSNERVDENGRIQVVTQDPIVCLEVKGGYIVLAAWGEEGQDPKVFNAENN